MRFEIQVVVIVLLVVERFAATPGIGWHNVVIEVLGLALLA